MSAVKKLDELDSYSCLPDRPYCSNDKTAKKILPKAIASKNFDYIQINHPMFKHFIVIDVDGGDIEDWSKMSLPEPSWIAINKKDKRKYHICWQLNNGVNFSGKANEKPKKFFESLTIALKELLPGADRDFNGLITKNPFKKSTLHDVIFINNKIDMMDLYNVDCIKEICQKLLTQNIQWRKTNDAVFDAEGRNCTEFNRARLWAYRNVGRYEHYDEFDSGLNEFIQNNYVDIGNKKELTSIKKSVARWVWARREDFKKRKKRSVVKPKAVITAEKIIMHFDKSLSMVDLAGKVGISRQALHKTHRELIVMLK